MQILLVILLLLVGCGAKTTPVPTEEPANNTPTETTNTPTETKDTSCLAIDCMEGHQCVNGDCVANEEPTVQPTEEQPKVDRCARMLCIKDHRCIDGQCVSNLEPKTDKASPVETTYFDECGCGCCGGKPGKEVCLDTQEAFDKKRAEVAERRKSLSPQACSKMGCSFGVRYKLCL
jgi:hypothetical protein